MKMKFAKEFSTEHRASLTPGSRVRIIGTERIGIVRLILNNEFWEVEFPDRVESHRPNELELVPMCPEREEQRSGSKASKRVAERRCTKYAEHVGARAWSSWSLK